MYLSGKRRYKILYARYLIIVITLRKVTEESFNRFSIRKKIGKPIL